MDSSLPDIRQTYVDFLPNIDLVHEIIPRRLRRETPNQLDGLRLDRTALFFGDRHELILREVSTEARASD
jgi:hypothetical protein